MVRSRHTALWLLMCTSMASSAEPETNSGAAYCEVSSEEVVASTSEQGVTAETSEYMDRLRRFVSETVAEVRSSYKIFFEDLRAEPEMVDALSRLIARRELLSTGWISPSEPSVSHDQSTSDSMLLQETDTLLQQLLTREEFALLENYRDSLRTRELLKPVISRLQSAGLPPSSDQPA
jgi:hypothetical protein